MPSLAIIPDIHMRQSVFQHALDLREQGHPVVLIGDYVDNGPRANDPKFIRRIFSFCREYGAVPLIGNHDLAYLYPHELSFRKNGYEEENAAEIAAVYDEFRSIFKYIYRVDHYLISHAGVSSTFAQWIARKYNVEGLDNLIHYINEHRPPELFWCSPHNEGDDPFDGPTWLRLPQYTGAFEKEGITQVVGHSSQSTIRLKQNLLMIDVRLPLLVEWV